MDAANSKTRSLEEANEKLKGENFQLRQNIADLSTDITTADEENDTLKSSISAKDLDLSTLQGQLNLLQSDKPKLNKENEILTGRVKTLEAKKLVSNEQLAQGKEALQATKQQLLLVQQSLSKALKTSISFSTQRSSCLRISFTHLEGRYSKSSNSNNRWKFLQIRFKA
jgi:chromosome segregation ATPase